MVAISVINCCNVTSDSEIFNSLGWFLWCCRTNKINMFQKLYTSTMTGDKAILSLPPTDKMVNLKPTPLTTIAEVDWSTQQL